MGINCLGGGFRDGLGCPTRTAHRGSWWEKSFQGYFEKRLDSSPSHVSKIQRGEANLTLSSLAHIFALLGKDPHDIFKGSK